jgi:hypothetical protein
MLGYRRQSDFSMRLRKWSTEEHPESRLNMQRALPPKDMCISFFINTPRVLRYLTLGGDQESYLQNQAVNTAL